MKLLVKVLLSLSKPSLSMAAPPLSIANDVLVEFAAWSTPVEMLVFLIVLFVAPAPVPRLIRHTAAVFVAVFVLVIVRSRVVPPLVFEPSTTIKSALFNLTIQLDEPEIVGLTLVSGLIVTVLVEVAPRIGLMV